MFLFVKKKKKKKKKQLLMGIVTPIKKWKWTQIQINIKIYKLIKVYYIWEFFNSFNWFNKINSIIHIYFIHLESHNSFNDYQGLRAGIFNLNILIEIFNFICELYLFYLFLKFKNNRTIWKLPRFTIKRFNNDNNNNKYVY